MATFKPIVFSGMQPTHTLHSNRFNTLKYFIVLFLGSNLSVSAQGVSVEAVSMRQSSQRHISIIVKVKNDEPRNLSLVVARCSLSSEGVVYDVTSAPVKNVKALSTTHGQAVGEYRRGATAICELESVQ